MGKTWKEDKYNKWKKPKDFHKKPKKSKGDKKQFPDPIDDQNWNQFTTNFNENE